MKLDPAIIVYILRLVLCNDRILIWLKEQAKKTETPLDDISVTIIEMLLCSKE